VSGHGIFLPRLIGQKLASCCQIWAKTHTISRFDSMSVAVRLFHITHISPMNVVWVAQEENLLVRPWHLFAQAVSKIGILMPNLGKNSHNFKV
jgi:hypothetical protein